MTLSIRTCPVVLELSLFTCTPASNLWPSAAAKRVYCHLQPSWKKALVKLKATGPPVKEREAEGNERNLEGGGGGERERDRERQREGMRERKRERREGGREGGGERERGRERGRGRERRGGERAVLSTGSCIICIIYTLAQGRVGLHQSPCLDTRARCWCCQC